MSNQVADLRNCAATTQPRSDQPLPDTDSSCRAEDRSLHRKGVETGCEADRDPGHVADEVNDESPTGVLELQGEKQRPRGARSAARPGQERDRFAHAACLGSSCRRPTTAGAISDTRATRRTPPMSTSRNLAPPSTALTSAGALRHSCSVRYAVTCARSTTTFMRPISLRGLRRAAWTRPGNAQSMYAYSGTSSSSSGIAISGGSS